MEFIIPRPARLLEPFRSSHPAKFVSLSQLRKLRQCQQVAAICYRMHGGVIEFLLVRTRNQRWIFPKGNAEPGLTLAQAAALEAFEEAGVHGRMEETCFIRYTRSKGGARNLPSLSADNQIAVNAYLCEVTRLERPQEAGRNPTWFPAEKAKRRLREERSRDYGNELAMVIDQAAGRVHQKKRGRVVEGIQNVRFIDGRPSMQKGKAKFVSA